MADVSDETARRLTLVHAHLDEGVPLARIAREEGVPIRTARRWLARYRASGPVGLAGKPQSDAGRRKITQEVVDLVEGLALRRSPLRIAAIHRRIAKVASERGLAPISYGSVRAIVRALDPAMLTLAHEGAAAYLEAITT